MSEIRLANPSGYDGRPHDNEHRIIREVLAKHEKDEIRHITDHRFENRILALFQEAQQRTKVNVYKTIFDVIEQLAINVFFTGGVDEFSKGWCTGLPSPIELNRISSATLLISQPSQYC